MRKLLVTAIVFFLLTPFNAFNQQEGTTGLKKYFWNFTPFIGLESGTKASINPGTYLMTGGLLYKMGNNWLIKDRGNTSTFFKLTWARIGLFPQGLILTPLHVGAGLHYDFNLSNSIESSLNGGLVISTDDALNPSLEFNYLIAPEVKINLGEFSIGLEYSIRTFRDLTGRPTARWHYISLVIGGSFGSLKN